MSSFVAFVEEAAICKNWKKNLNCVSDYLISAKNQSGHLRMTGIQRMYDKHGERVCRRCQEVGGGWGV